MPAQSIVVVKPLAALSDAELVSMIRAKLGPVDTAHALAEEVNRRIKALRARVVVAVALHAMAEAEAQ